MLIAAVAVAVGERPRGPIAPTRPFSVLPRFPGCGTALASVRVADEMRASSAGFSAAARSPVVDLAVAPPISSLTVEAASVN